MFYKNHVQHKLSGGTRLDDADVFAWNNPIRYPLGSIAYECEGDDRPQIDWAKKFAKTKKYPLKWKCLGIKEWLYS